jgi:hypothetical protein
MRKSISSFACLGLLIVFSMVVATGCGSKPAYCSDLTTLESSIKDLPNQATSGGVSGLQTQLKTVQANAKTLVASAKSDFPTQSSAVESSINQLKSSVDSLASAGKPSASAVAALGLNASAAVKSVNDFTSATQSKCK